MNNFTQRPLALIILDGWGISNEQKGNAIALAHTPFFDEMMSRYPHTRLAAAGEGVGLAAGSAGNAEVGHLNIGAGRVVPTDPTRIASAIRDGSFFENDVLVAAMQRAKNASRPVHLIGLLSDGEVHSSPENLFALIRMAKRLGVGEVYVHAILDGRDVPQRTADIYIEALEIKMADIGLGRIATLCGRFFAMDANENWERTARAFTMLFHAEGERAADAATAVRNSFLRGISDEFIAPIVLESSPGVPVATIRENDTVIFFNHRADTMRQLARSVAVPDPGSFSVDAKPRVEAACLTEYDRSFGLPVAFPPESRGNVLAQILSHRRLANYRIAESDRFAHVTSLMNGGTGEPNLYEQHIHIPAINASLRENQPEMQSFKIADRVLRGMEADASGVFIVNFAAADLLAETGSLDKTIEAVQFVDTCLGGIVEKVTETGGIAVVTSSHGHCEAMIDSTGDVNRFPSLNDVPLCIVDPLDQDRKLADNGSLQDIAPTVLGLLGIERPSEMTGRDLRIV